MSTKKLPQGKVIERYMPPVKPGAFPTPRERIDWSKSAVTIENVGTDNIPLDEEVDLPTFAVLDGGKK